MLDQKQTSCTPRISSASGIANRADPVRRSVGHALGETAATGNRCARLGESWHSPEKSWSQRTTFERERQDLRAPPPNLSQLLISG